MTRLLAWHFFIPFLKAHRIKIGILVALPAIWCLAETAAPFLIKILIDRLNHISESTLITERFLVAVILAYAGLMLLLEVSIRACNYVWIITFPQIRAAIQRKGLFSLQNHSLEFIQNRFVGDILNKYRNLYDSFEKISKTILYGYYPTIFSFIVALIFICFISKIFAAIFFVWFLAMNLVTVSYFQRCTSAFEKLSQDQNQLLGHIGSLICNVVTVMTFPRDHSSEKAFSLYQQNLISSTKQAELITFHADVWRSLFSWLLLASMAIFLSIGWFHSWITLGDFAFIASICFYVRRSVWMTSAQLIDFFKEIGILNDALELIHQVDKKEEAKQPLPKIEPKDIDFKNVHFAYHSDQPAIFQNLS